MNFRKLLTFFGVIERNTDKKRQCFETKLIENQNKI